MSATVLFDLYGTLVEPDWSSLHRGRAAIAGRVGIPWAAARPAWDSTHRRRMSGAFGSLEGDLAAVFTEATGDSPPRVAEATLVELAARERENWRHGVRLYADVRPALHALHAMGTRLAIVTNASAEAAGVVPELGLQPLLESVVASCEARVVKPELFRVALHSLGADARHATLVDDEPMQLDGAAELGMRTILIRRGGKRGTPLSGGSDHPVVTDLHQVTALLSGADRALPSRL